MIAEQFVVFGSPEYWLLVSVLCGARAADFLSTWVATPNLLLEANPIARKMGWRIGLIVNGVLCFGFALWPLPTIVIVTTSVLVAARNFQSAWLMRSMGEGEYRSWMGARLAEAPRRLFFFCLAAQTALLSVVGGVLMYFSRWELVPFGIGMGLITYAFAVLFYTMLSVWRVAFRQL